MEDLVALRAKLCSVIIKSEGMHIINFIIQLVKDEIHTVTSDQFINILNTYKHIMNIEVHGDSSWSYKSYTSNKILSMLPLCIKNGIPSACLRNKIQLYSLLIFVVVHIRLLNKFKKDPEILIKVDTIDSMVAQREVFQTNVKELTDYKKAIIDKLAEMRKLELINKITDIKPNSFTSMIKNIFSTKIIINTLEGVDYWEYINPDANKHVKVVLKALSLYKKDKCVLPASIDADSLFYILMPVIFHIDQCNKNINKIYYSRAD